MSPPKVSDITSAFRDISICTHQTGDNLWAFDYLMLYVMHPPSSSNSRQRSQWTMKIAEVHELDKNHKRFIEFQLSINSEQHITHVGLRVTIPHPLPNNIAAYVVGKSPVYRKDEITQKPFLVKYYHDQLRANLHAGLARGEILANTDGNLLQFYLNIVSMLQGAGVLSEKAAESIISNTKVM
jgi:hypothetical protein